ncbi:MAG: hypothetical protein K8F91_15465, partial [Candidatus Obscuribacterales bacterium]|nr:hypothetical protein [Candidatus Obscuribacterales bacterium]
WLSKLTEIAYATAHEIFKRLTTVIENNRSPDAHCVGSELFVEIFSKRSRETPAREHPRAEQDEMERLVSKTTDARLEEPELSSTLLGELAIGERDLYKILSYTPVSFSDLCDQLGSTVQEMSVRITMLELRGLAVKLAGDRFVRSKFDRALLAPERKSSTQAYKNATRIMIFVRTYSHGISRKYLQNYAAAFWCHVDRSRWNVGSLLDACLDSEPISNSQIRNSVTPLLVKVTP